MTLQHLFIATLAFHVLTISSAATEKEGTSDSRYKRAHRLLFPEEDPQERARQAVHILTEGRTRADLNEKELSLLCRAYNELTQKDNQLEASTRLWKMAPQSDDAMRWMINSLHNKYMFSDDNRPLFAFVDRSLKMNQGNKRKLLVFKAHAVIRQRKGMTQEQKRDTASQLLVESFANPAPTQKDFNPQSLVDPKFIDSRQPFCSFFSTKERNGLKQRMAEARRHARQKRTAVDVPKGD